MTTSHIEQMQIRPMRWWDIPEVCALEQRLFPVDAWTSQMFWAELAQVGSSRVVVVVEINDSIIGYASLRWSGHEGDINTIAIAPEFQGQGFGRRLLAWLEDQAKQRNVEQIFLEVRGDNQPALTLYRATGYESIDTRKDYYAPGVAAVVMRKRLSHA